MLREVVLELQEKLRIVLDDCHRELRPSASDGGSHVLKKAHPICLCLEPNAVGSATAELKRETGRVVVAIIGRATQRNIRETLVALPVAAGQIETSYPHWVVWIVRYIFDFHAQRDSTIIS